MAEADLVSSEAVGDGVWRIMLQRGQKRNAMTPGMLEALVERVELLPSEARAVVLCGEGGIFCAGFDLEMCVADEGALRALLEGLSRAVAALRRVEVPVIAAVERAAIAGGAALLGGVDVVVSHAEAKIGYPVLRLGISPAVSWPFMMEALSGGAVRRLLLEPSVVSGKRACALGLVHECVSEREDVMDEAERIAREIAAKPGGGLLATKRLLNELAGCSEDQRMAGLDASLGGVGADEQRDLLNKAWQAMQAARKTT